MFNELRVKLISVRGWMQIHFFLIEFELDCRPLNFFKGGQIFPFLFFADSKNVDLLRILQCVI